MAIKQVITVVLDVGQGQSTFTCIYDDSSPRKLIHALLFDCGTDKSSPETDTNIQYIADKLATMDTPALDLLVFSHSDNDHISLMYSVLDAYSKKKGVAALKIKNTWYAGDEDFYTKNGFNILDYLAKYCKAFTTPDFSESQYKINKGVGEWAEFIWQDPATVPTVKVGMLIGNVIDDNPGILVKDTFGTAAEKKNRVSIVCALFHEDRSVLICGDATNRTMAWVNHAFAGQVLSKNLMVTVPHHGSRRTGLEVPSTESANQKAIDVVKTFVKTSNAKTATISAFAKHDHPSLEMVNYFMPPLAAAAVVEDDRLLDSHFALFNVDISLKDASSKAVKQGYCTFTTKANVYATYYFGATPKFSYQFTGKKVGAAGKYVSGASKAVNEHACWAYVSQVGGATSMTGYLHMPRATSNAFTDTSPIPFAVAGEVAGGGPIMDPETGAMRGAETVFSSALQSSPAAPPSLASPSDPPFTPLSVSRPALSSAPLAAASLRRLRMFR